MRVLDPACGSGNFLYVVLQKLKNPEKQVILYAMDRGFSGYLPQVGPWQLHGIEINPYAYELAQMTFWIGWLQWIQSNGFGEPQEPILQELTTAATGSRRPGDRSRRERACEPGCWRRRESAVALTGRCW